MSKLKLRRKRDKELFVRKTFVDDFMMVTTFNEYNLMEILSTVSKYIVYFGSISALIYAFLIPLFLKTESRKYLMEKHDEHPTEEQLEDLVTDIKTQVSYKGVLRMRDRIDELDALVDSLNQKIDKLEDKGKTIQ